MKRGAVTLVPVKAITRKSFVHPHQIGITCGLGQDGRSRNRRHQRIATHDRADRTCKVRTLVAVHQRQFGANRQRLDGAFHGKQRRLKNVVVINLLDRGACNSPRQGTGTNLGCQDFPARSGERLRICQAVDRTRRIQYHGGGEYSACQRTASGLVNACHICAAFARDIEQVRLRL